MSECGATITKVIMAGDGQSLIGYYIIFFKLPSLLHLMAVKDDLVSFKNSPSQDQPSISLKLWALGEGRIPTTMDTDQEPIMAAMGQR